LKAFGELGFSAAWREIPLVFTYYLVDRRNIMNSKSNGVSDRNSLPLVKFLLRGRFYFSGNKILHTRPGGIEYAFSVGNNDVGIFVPDRFDFKAHYGRVFCVKITDLQ